MSSSIHDYRTRQIHFDPETLGRDQFSETDTDTQRIVSDIAKPILDVVNIPEVEEMFINREKEIIVKLRQPNQRGDLYEYYSEPNLDHERLTGILKILANTSNTPKFGSRKGEFPVAYGTLPGGHRFMAGIGPNFQYNVTEMSNVGSTVFCCRQQTAQRRTPFSAWGLEKGKMLPDYNPGEKSRADGNDPLQRLYNIIRRGEPLLISGDTNTGKTTFLNEVLRNMPIHTRIVAIQDTLELRIIQPNHITVWLPRTGLINDFNYKSVIEFTTRANADSIIFSEVSSANIMAMLEVANSGSQNFMSTIHAPTAYDASIAAADRASTKENPLDAETKEQIAARIRSTFHIVQILNLPGNDRRIVEIRPPDKKITRR